MRPTGVTLCTVCHLPVYTQRRTANVHGYSACTEQSIRNIRQNGGCLLRPGQAAIVASASHYMHAELNSALSNFSRRSPSIRGCYAALLAHGGEGRNLMLALLSLGSHMALASSMWSLFRITPIRKVGPPVVRNLKNLRPISLCTAMLQVQDSLRMWWCKARLEEYSGPDQVEGIFD